MRTSVRLWLVLLAALALGVILLISRNHPTEARNASRDNSPKIPNVTVTVNVQSNNFSPQFIHIRRATTVNWHWLSGTHSTTSDTGIWNSNNHAPSFDFPIVFNQVGTFRYFCQIHGGTGSTGMYGIVVVDPTTSDFDGDQQTDLAVWRGSTGNWYMVNSSNGTTTTHLDWGRSTLNDQVVPGDYDGDGKADLAVWRPAEGNWYIINSSTGNTTAKGWGASTDKPVPADYDRDGKTDLAVFRPSEGNWYIINSANNTITKQGWGAATDTPAPGDYDGDGKADIAVFRPSEGNWYVRKSTGGVTIQNWGASTDKLVPADYDGDGKTDFAVFRPSENNWYVLKSAGGVQLTGWGASGDQLVPGDYDNDGKADVAIFRPNEGNWYIIQSSTGTPALRNLGQSGDTPVPLAYLPQ